MSAFPNTAAVIVATLSNVYYLIKTFRKPWRIQAAIVVLLNPARSMSSPVLDGLDLFVSITPIGGTPQLRNLLARAFVSH